MATASQQITNPIERTVRMMENVEVVAPIWQSDFETGFYGTLPVTHIKMNCTVGK